MGYTTRFIVGKEWIGSDSEQVDVTVGWLSILTTATTRRLIPVVAGPIAERILAMLLRHKIRVISTVGRLK